MKTWPLLIVLVALVSGCATTRAPSDVGKLQIQMAQLERKMDESGDQLQALSQRVDQMEENVDSLEPYPADEPAKRTTTVSVSTSYADGEIIRVPVSPEKVQTALKNAGYYNGTVDGKIGSGTKAAIRDFQKEHNLNADGVLGRKTWTELQKYL